MVMRIKELREAANLQQRQVAEGGEQLECVHMIATAANLVAAVCDIILLVLLWRWYGPNAKR